MSTHTLQNAAVEVDTSTLERYSHGSITGIVIIRIDDVALPVVGWSDFPVVILSWWLEPVSRILQGKSYVWDCRFMDGPITVRMEQQHDDVWSLRCLRNDRIQFEASVSCGAFIRSLLDAAQKILGECQRRGWQDRDIEALDSAVRMIEI